MAPEAVEHKLAAILSADAVGYSRLMADDEAATIRTLSSYREQIGVLVREHRGRVVDAPGDNILAEFPTALEAVRCAVEMQGVLRARNASLSAERRMDFRIGVHMGDVATEGERIYGDGVNIAARLEALAEAGGVCISATVHEQVRNKLEAGFTDLGDQTVKNIPDQVRVYRVQPGSHAETAAPTAHERTRRLPRALLAMAAVLLLLGIGLWASWPRPLGLLIDLAGVSSAPVEPPLPAKPSIAVLPFANMSGDSEQEYFTDGLTEDLTNGLAQLSHLFVIARNSAFVYKGQRVNVEDVGRELGVRYVVEGSVRKADSRVRVTAQLIDATSGGHVWSQSYDRDLSDVFTLQSEITEEILGAVGVGISHAEAQRLARKPSESYTAIDAVWRGLYHHVRGTREGLEEARRLYERAIELDPRFGAAYGQLGNTYVTEVAYGWSSDPALLDRAEQLARRGIELDSGQMNSHMTLAFVNFFRGRPEAALVNAERTIEISPNNTAAHATRGLVLAHLGRFIEASRAIKKALRLNPRPDIPVLLIVAYVNHGAGRPDEAIEMLERVRLAAPDNVTAMVALAAFYQQEGRSEEARKTVPEILRIRPDLTAQTATDLIPGLETIAGTEEFARYPDHLRAAGLP